MLQCRHFCCGFSLPNSCLAHLHTLASKVLGGGASGSAPGRGACAILVLPMFPPATSMSHPKVAPCRGIMAPSSAPASGNSRNEWASRRCCSEHVEGLPHPNADVQPGISLSRAERRKRRETYPELLRARRCRLVVFGIETGGRWSQEAASFTRLLAHARALSAPAPLRQAARAAWVQRWSAVLAVAAQRAVAASLLDLPADSEPGARCLG